MHRHPGVRHDKIRPAHGLLRVAFDLGADTLRPGEVHEDRFGIKCRRTRVGQVKAELPRRMGEAGKDVVAVAAPGHLLALDRVYRDWPGPAVDRLLLGL